MLKWFKRTADETPSAPSAPEVMGLRLGGAFELDDLKLRLLEPELVVANVARTQLIQAVGVVKLDDTSTLLRYYTDDEGYLQLLLTGGMQEQHVSDVKLWYFYETKSVGSQADWDALLARVSQPSTQLDGQAYQRVWEGTGEQSPPVAMTETTYAEDGSVSETDQFAMLYERVINSNQHEYLLSCAEEKLIHDERLDRCWVLSTGLDIQPADLTVIG